MARPRTDRKFPIFPRLTKANATWVAKMRAKYEDKSQADFIDRLITYARVNPTKVNLDKI